MTVYAWIPIALYHQSQVYVRLSPTVKTQIGDLFLHLGHATRKGHAPRHSRLQQSTHQLAEAVAAAGAVHPPPPPPTPPRHRRRCCSPSTRPRRARPPGAGRRGRPVTVPVAPQRVPTPAAGARPPGSDPARSYSGGRRARPPWRGSGGAPLRR